jgi:parallel beta-helix repeat protein
MTKTFPSTFPAGTSTSQAFASLVSGDTLTFDPGVYDHVDILPVTGQDITIDGTGARLHALTPKKASLVVQDSQNVKLTNLHLTGSPVVRSASDASCGILVYRSSGIKILRNHVNSFAGAGIHLQRTSDFLIQGNLVQDTLADSIHMTNRTNNGRVLYNTVRGCGDDGVACVGYVKQLGILHDILIKGNHIYGNTHGRGVTIEGADREIGRASCRERV